MANALGKLFGDIASAIKIKRGEPETVTYKPAEFPKKISEISVGNDDDIEAIEDALDAINGEVIGETLYTVTFIGVNGETLCKVPVYEEDNCDDPVSNGTIPKPTKESTATQVFTYSGWSLTAGGSADKTALSNVMGDRTVYAAFTESVRTYTVRFYNDGTLLTTKQVEYGAAASYTGKVSKENYLFTGWNPDPSNVTEDMDCYAVWVESQEFSVASWDFVTMAVNAGEAKNLWSVGDEKDITLTWDDGTSESCTLQIASFDESGATKNGKPFITLISKGLLSKPSYGPVNSGSNTSAYWWEDYPQNNYSRLASFLYNTVVPALPTQLRSAMKSVQILDYTASNAFYNLIGIPNDIHTGLTVSSATEAEPFVNDKTYLPLFDTNNSKRIKCTPDGTAQEWWLNVNTTLTSSTNYFVSTDGSGVGENADNYNKKYVFIKLFV